MSDKIDNMVFNYTKQANTHVDLFGMKEVDPRTEQIHNALMVAGFVPGLGNIADAADALLYAFEGEFGDAAISAAAMIPFVGQAVSTKKILKAAKESGEEMITLYRGVDKWHSGEMVKNGKFVGGGGYDKLSPRFKGIDKSDKSIWLSEKKDIAEGYAGARSFWSDAAMTERVTKPRTGPLLEFEIPESYITKFGKYEDSMGEWAFRFDEGIPKEFLTKVHK